MPHRSSHCNASFLKEAWYELEVSPSSHWCSLENHWPSECHNAPPRCSLPPTYRLHYSWAQMYFVHPMWISFTFMQFSYWDQKRNSRAYSRRICIRDFNFDDWLSNRLGSNHSNILAFHWKLMSGKRSSHLCSTAFPVCTGSMCRQRLRRWKRWREVGLLKGRECVLCQRR